MKLSKLLLVGALASVSVSAIAADITLRMTGSTAFRKSVSNAIVNVMGANGRYGYTDATSLSGATTAVYYTPDFQGTGKSLLVQTSWSGSEAGILAVADVTPDPITNWITEASVSGNAAASTTALTSPTTESAFANVALADNAQAESTQKGVGFYKLTSSRVGVIPFVWVRSSSLNTAIQASLDKLTNLTTGQVQGIFANSVALSMWSHNAADQMNFVLPCGRDSFSGTRLNAVLEAYLGSKNALSSVALNQQALTTTATNITAYAPHSSSAAGYDKGSALVKDFAKPAVASITTAVFVGYAGISDVGTNYPGVSLNTTTGEFTWSGATSTTSPVLTYNGVPHSYAAVKNGTYSYWGYVHLAYRDTVITGDLLTAVKAIEKDIIDVTASAAGIKLSEMSCERVGAGQIIISL